MTQARITLAHGSGGQAMRDLIESLFVEAFDSPALAELEDQARLDLSLEGGRLAMTTDGYVVDPLFFPGGDIGKLAVSGTVNDLAVGGARPAYLSCAMILEEGLALADLQRIVESLAATARGAGVAIVTGDTKVVPRGAADGMFITTAGVGVIPAGMNLTARQIQPGDIILINGTIGDHGVAVLDARGELALEHGITSDCRPLNRLIARMLTVCPGIRAMRDPTRGGVAAVLHEFAAASGWCLRLDEAALPVREEVRGVCEILGLDPLYLANEGKVLAVIPRQAAGPLLKEMRADPDGIDSAVIGEVSAEPAGLVLLRTHFGSDRIIDLPVGELLPRIC